MTDSWRQATIAALIALACALAAPARAADSGDGAVILDTDESTVLAGGDVHTSKPIPENFVGAGGRIVVDQPVGNNAVLVGGSINVRAPVGDNVRAAGGSVTIDGPVGGGVSVAAGDVRIGRGATIAGSAGLFAGTITIDGRIEGSLKASGERLVINGEVKGDVKAAADEIVLGPGAKIMGSLRYVSGKEITKGEGAVIAGTVTRKEPGSKEAEEDMPHVKHGPSIAGTVFSFLALLGCGALFLSVAPIFSVETPDRIKATPLKAFGVGLLSVIGVPILALMFIMTIVGIPVGLLLFMLYPIALLLGFIVGTLFIGNAGAGLLKRPPPPTIAAAVGYFALALALVMLVTKAPSIGGLLLFVLILMGVGAFEVELYRRMKGGARMRRVSSAAA
jgi:cytoskeletal protein CcmA (bactofilin family)